MRYIKARNILPEEVIQLIQEYVDGEFLYIPRKDGKQKAWGEKNGTREGLKERNARIHEKYKGGAKVADLSGEYFLSEQSIRRILCQENAKRSSSIHNHL